MKFGVGQSVERVEDQRLLRGGGRFTDDTNLPGQLHGCVVHSPHPHARIAFSPALRPPGEEGGLSASATFTPSGPTFPTGCHACEVEHEIHHA